MTKAEILTDIIYTLKLHDSADFEADNESYAVDKLEAGGFVIKSICRYIEVRNLTEAKKEIGRLGKKLLLL